MSGGPCADNSINSETQELPELVVVSGEHYGIQEALSLKIFLPKILSGLLSAVHFGTRKSTVSKRLILQSQNKLNYGVGFTTYIYIYIYIYIYCHVT